MIVVIPVFNEVFELTVNTLRSLEIAHSHTPFHVVTLWVINDYVGSDPSITKRNKSFIKAFDDAKQKGHWKIEHHIMNVSFPSFKKGGVGFARKFGMDAGLFYFKEIEKPNGILICLDADTTVSENYFLSIQMAFASTNRLAASIGFAHPLDSQAIIEYELHLRYFINMQRLVHLPFAFQTVGSAMALRSFAYAKELGMPTRQAGEDFYFLQKFISKGQLFDINEVLAIPSSRQSDRVPFGTGRAVLKYEEKQELLTYHPDSFLEINLIWDCLLHYWKTHEFLLRDGYFKAYLLDQNVLEILNKNSIQATSEFSFIKLFFSWFNAFKLFKYLHFAREKGRLDIPVLEASNTLFATLKKSKKSTSQEALIELRRMDAQSSYVPFANVKQVE